MDALSDILALAGHLGLDAREESMAYDRPTASESAEALARAVLKVLGLTLGDEWEWGVRVEGVESGPTFVPYVTEGQAREVAARREYFKLVVRPKVTVEWRDAP